MAVSARGVVILGSVAGEGGGVARRRNTHRAPDRAQTRTSATRRARAGSRADRPRSKSGTALPTTPSRPHEKRRRKQQATTQAHTAGHDAGASSRPRRGNRSNSQRGDPGGGSRVAYSHPWRQPHGNMSISQSGGPGGG
jgi:hypothetical protein